MSTPTHVAALVEALRPVAYIPGNGKQDCGLCGWSVARCDGRGGRRLNTGEMCLGFIARSALASRESRPRLRDDAALVEAISDVLFRTFGLGLSQLAVGTFSVADAIEARLLGGPGRADVDEHG